jgi:hypothetical protein
MPITELVTRSLGRYGNKEILDPTENTGNTHTSIGDWLLQKRAAGIPVYDVTSTVVVRGVDYWAAFEELHSTGVILTVFRIDA